MAMNQFCGEAYGVGRNGGKAVFVDGACRFVGELYGEAQRLQQCFPERHAVPEEQYARNTQGYSLGRHNGSTGPILEEQLFAFVVQIGHAFHASVCFAHLFANFCVGKLAHNLALGAAIAGDP